MNANQKRYCDAHNRPATITLRTGDVACSQACAMALIFNDVSSWSEDKARRRYDEIMARCGNLGGKVGGLSEYLADELQFVADKLGIRLVWQHYDFRSGEFGEGRGNAKTHSA